ncbi:putative diphthamide synthesis protein-domain-containing protein [Limtongia smithiae]|uniref:putative diphthamide synthesis protein-domain-containing protein n=1 Tax=Limtongia smithiae TaxID=1125753 RepID=UPI0034CE437D
MPLIGLTDPPLVRTAPRRFAGRGSKATVASAAELEGAAATDSATLSAVRIRPTAKRVPRIPLMSQIPAEILHDEALNQAIALLPANYDFEVHKCVWHIRRYNCARVALQMPEGLLIYSCVIADILERFCDGVEVVVMGDVTYGACCVDDYTAAALGCDLLIHYAHSCLVPVDVTSMRVLYVFVTISIDVGHLSNTLEAAFSPNTRLAVVGTIQFNPALHALRASFPEHTAKSISIDVPQIVPLSRGELLGCTAPRIDPTKTDAIVYIGDGRFHLESAMIHNPGLPAYRYDPYSRKLTEEEYAHAEMLAVRRDALLSAAKHAKHVGLILGTLGRQGNYATFDKIKRNLEGKGITYTLILLSEIFPQKLAEFEHIDAFVQVACPRLSIDWGYAFAKPLLTPYEASIAWGDLHLWGDLQDIIAGTAEPYKMDYYAKDGLGRESLKR